MACIQDDLLLRHHIAVDRFTYSEPSKFKSLKTDNDALRREVVPIKYILLTHAHQDHYQGFRKSDTTPLQVFCTPLTKQLLPPALRDHPYVTFHTSDYGEPVTRGSVTWRFWNANHCDGSAMVELQFPNSLLLYTGDFRYDAEVFQIFFQRHSRSYFDRLYIDDYFSQVNVAMPTYDDTTQLLLETLLPKVRSTSRQDNVLPYILNISVLGIEMIMRRLQHVFRGHDIQLEYIYDTRERSRNALRLHQINTLVPAVQEWSSGQVAEPTVGDSRRRYLPIGWYRQVSKRKPKTSGLELDRTWLLCTCTNFFMSRTPDEDERRVRRFPFCTHSSQNEIEAFLERLHDVASGPQYRLACNHRWIEKGSQD